MTELYSDFNDNLPSRFDGIEAEEIADIDKKIEQYSDFDKSVSSPFKDIGENIDAEVAKSSLRQDVVQIENRAHKRKLLRKRADLWLTSSHKEEVTLNDISLGGIGLLSDKNIKKGKELKLEFSHVIDGEPQNVTLTLKIMYSILSNQGFKIGAMLQNENNLSEFILVKKIVSTQPELENL